MIVVEDLEKVFKKPIRKPGIIGMFKTLFSRKYETKVAVNKINFTINEGEIVGYIGSNGAGKSTTIKMMCGILNPTSGKVLINGIEPYKKRQTVAKQIGVVFGQKTQLWWDIPLIESFNVLKEIYLISDEEYKERFDFLQEVLDIKDFINQPVRTLSLGQRMRADLAASLLHNPKILFLDEPTIGLDVLVKEKIRNAILMMNKKYNTTVILTTHDMSDIEMLCNRIIMIEKGNIIYDGSLKDIKNKFGDLRTLNIQLDTTSINLDELKTFNDQVNYEFENGTLIAKFDAAKVSLDKVINEILKKFTIKDMKIKELTIEDIAKEMYRKDEDENKKE
ncbi:MAG: ATP-binding cassette domain-containing protein [Bacilli bacterium]|nr:ATP-binding cassette domain-containing protein [Bacilli bacterium]